MERTELALTRHYESLRTDMHVAEGVSRLLPNCTVSEVDPVNREVSHHGSGSTHTACSRTDASKTYDRNGGHVPKVDWSAAQYQKFEEERTRPVRDLLTHIPTTTVRSAADLGCGPGNSTEVLQAYFPDAAITAIDSAADMIEAARRRLPGISFEIADIAQWSDAGPFDIILSNAALQWVPDHESLLLTLLRKVTPGGSLAVQIPDNLEEPAHRLMRQIATQPPWASKLTGAADASANRHSANWYYGALRKKAAKVDLWRTTYYHSLSGGAAAVSEWFQGTGLRPFLDRLDTAERSGFLARYQELIALAYPARPDGTVLLPFPRLFFVATV